jgi:hypothetical protein
LPYALINYGLKSMLGSECVNKNWTENSINY